MSQQKNNSTYPSSLCIDKYTHHILENVSAYIKYLSYKNIAKYLMIKVNCKIVSALFIQLGVSKHLYEFIIFFVWPQYIGKTIYI